MFSTPDPESRISDPRSENRNKGEGDKIVVIPFCRHKYHKIKKIK
jgi:hypothetical protein